MVQQKSKDLYNCLYNIDTQEQVSVPMCGFDVIRRGSYFGEQLIGEAESGEAQE